MEKVNLRWIETCRTSWAGKINGSKCTNSSLSWNFVCFNFVLQLEERLICENKSNFIFHMWNERFEFRNETAILLSKVFKLILLNTLSSHFKNFLSKSLKNKSLLTFFAMTKILLDDLRSFLITWTWLEPTFVKLVKIICLCCPKSS